MMPWSVGLEFRTEMMAHAAANENCEIGGVLLGEPTGSGQVSRVIPALRAIGTRTQVQFTHEVWADIFRIQDREAPKSSIVGWYHSHPGFGIFLSDDDLFIQRNFFADPRQIAVVIDPKTGQLGIFGWRGGSVELLELDEGRLGAPAR